MTPIRSLYLRNGAYVKRAIDPLLLRGPDAGRRGRRRAPRHRADDAPRPRLLDGAGEPVVRGAEAPGAARAAAGGDDPRPDAGAHALHAHRRRPDGAPRLAGDARAVPPHPERADRPPAGLRVRRA